MVANENRGRVVSSGALREEQVKLWGLQGVAYEDVDTVLGRGVVAMGIREDFTGGRLVREFDAYHFTVAFICLRGELRTGVGASEVGVGFV